MNPPLDYDDERDIEVYATATVMFAAPVALSAGTLAGNAGKPNEDSFAVVAGAGRLAAAVFDGATSLRSIPALEAGGLTGARYASHFLRRHFARYALEQPPAETLLRLNEDLLRAAAGLGGDLNDTHTLPSSTATLAGIDFDRGVVELAHVGDSFAIAYGRDGSSALLTPNGNERFDRQMRELISSIAVQRGLTPREARAAPEVHQALVDMYRFRNNRPDGQGCGIINGDPRVRPYIFAAQAPLGPMEALLLATDGLLPVDLSAERSDDRRRIRQIIEAAGLPELVRLKRASEDADPDWRHVRYKHSDDATAVFVRFL